MNTKRTPVIAIFSTTLCRCASLIGRVLHSSAWFLLACSFAFGEGKCEKIKYRVERTHPLRPGSSPRWGEGNPSQVPPWTKGDHRGVVTSLAVIGGEGAQRAGEEGVRVSSLLQASNNPIDQEWRFYGHDPGGMRFSPLAQINRVNVHQLQRAWTYEASRGSKSHSVQIEPFESTPLMVDGVLYFTTPTSSAIAMDGETGKEIWVFDPFSNESGTRRPMPSRGVAYWEGNSPVASPGEEQTVDKRIFYATLDGRLFALDAQ